MFLEQRKMKKLSVALTVLHLCPVQIALYAEAKV